MEIVKPDFAGNKENANTIREIADMVENGTIRDIVIVYDNAQKKEYAKFGIWNDRWRLLAALEYAKSVVD